MPQCYVSYITKWILLCNFIQSVLPQPSEPFEWLPGHEQRRDSNDGSIIMCSFRAVNAAWLNVSKTN